MTAAIEQLIEVHEPELCRHDAGVWSVEASTLRIAPGAWPARIRFVFGDADKREERSSVVVSRPRYETSGGELVSVTYACAHRPDVQLIIWND